LRLTVQQIREGFCMKSRLLALLFTLAWLVAAPSVRVTTDWIGAPPIHAQAAVATAPVPAGSARVWEGRNAEFEEYLRTADIDHFEEIPLGVTKPKRAYFKPGGLLESAAWKVLPPGRPAGYWESYKSEVAGYEVDKLLGMGMVPPSVEKKWKGQTAAAILWLKPIKDWKVAEKLPKPPEFDRQIVRMKMFDNLIGNKDRNQGNLLVDDLWNLYLIDHSRAFVSDKDLPPAAKLQHVDRKLWDKMLELDEATLMTALQNWVGKGEIKAIIARRDKMKLEIEKLVKATSEPAVFIR
jgi:hypothetical protein